MFFDHESMSDADYAALPPLVKKGEDREQVIDAIVKKWCTKTGAAGRDHAAVEAHVERGGFFLDNVALTDENTDQPINLRELIERVEERLRWDGAPEAFRARADLFILLRRCRVDRCGCSRLNIRPRFVAFQTMFGDLANFSQATFGDGAGFRRTSFGDGANFWEATLGDGADFEGATFGGWAYYFGSGAFGWLIVEVSNSGDEGYSRRMRYGEGADFRGAILTDANFSRADVRRADFHRAEVSGMKIFGTRLASVRGLFGKDRAIARTKPIEEYHAQNAIYANWWDCISWDRLRAIGALRLFAVSYLTIIFIVLYATLALWYNPLAAHARQSARKLMIDAAESAEPVSFLVTVLAQLPNLPVPGHLGWQLIATILLAAAATIYALLCPSEVKEATEVRWTRAMNQPLWEYRSANWSGIIARYTCAILFAAGGSYTAYYLAWRTWIAATYLLGW